MEILGLIPARAGSKGIPGKNIKRLNGRPLIEYTLEAAKQSKRLTRIIVTTDDPQVARIARRAGAQVPFLRPKRLATDQAPASGYVLHALGELKLKEDYRPDAVMILQPTSPCRNAADIDRCADLLKTSKADSVVSVNLLSAKYHPQWQCRIQGKLLNLLDGRSWEEIVTRRQALSPTFIRNGAIYIFWKKVFLKYGTIYGRRVCPYLMPPDRSVNIDDLDDWSQAEKFLKGIK